MISKCQTQGLLNELKVANYFIDCCVERYVEQECFVLFSFILVLLFAQLHLLFEIMVWLVVHSSRMKY